MIAIEVVTQDQSTKSVVHVYMEIQTHTIFSAYNKINSKNGNVEVVRFCPNFLLNTQASSHCTIALPNCFKTSSMISMTIWVWLSGMMSLSFLFDWRQDFTSMASYLSPALLSKLVGR